MQIKSIPEYYNLRFGKNVRILGAILLCLGGILNMGLFLKVGAVFIQAIFGFDDNAIFIIMIYIYIIINIILMIQM